MRTDDLIDALSRDPVPAMPPVSTLLLRGLAIAVPITAALLLATIGVRENLTQSWSDGWFVLKLALVTLLAAAGWRAVRISATPQGRAPRALAPAAGALLAISLAGVADLGMLGLEDWRDRLVGETAIFCLISIPLLSLAPLAAIIHGLRESAPSNPALAGASAGLLAGGLGAVLYGLHCTDDSPLFLAVWYLSAVAVVTLAGALAGRRWLRW